MPRILTVVRALFLVGLVLATSLRVAQPHGAADDLAAYVDPFIGTAPSPMANYGEDFDGGDTFPGAVYPAGMLAWSPDTVEHHMPGGYSYLDRTLKGFSLTHFSGRGCTVYQDVPILPTLGSAPPTFSHGNEAASPGFYSVTLDNGIGVELSVTGRTGFGRFTFPVTAAFTIDAAGSINTVFGSDVSVDPEQQMLTGWVESQVGCGTEHYRLYFAIAFDQPFRSARIDGSRAEVTFDTNVVQLKPAISYVSVQNALTNLAAENSDWGLQNVREAARGAWNDVLCRIEVHGGSAADLRVFYTALYHAFLEPNIFNDADGEYVGFDDQVHLVAPGHAQYANIAGWDQYRGLIQLRSILAPDQASDIIQSLVNDAAQGGGGMPRWEQANRNSAGMVGDSPAAFVASAYAFGARDFDAEAALAALDFDASSPDAVSGGHLVREDLGAWLQLGYVPEQPSVTLEYATDDFALAQFARSLGRDDLYERYMRRAANWRKTFPILDHGLVEGNAAQYTWMVPFDVQGVASALGGSDAAIARLDSLFTEVNAGPERPHSWIGNEPSLWAPWAYDFLAAPEKTQSVVHVIQREAFSDAPGGLPGNDDGGTLSAWYVFSAIGVFPAVPGTGGFAVGAPVFSPADLHLDGGHILHVTSDSLEATVWPYLDGARLSGSWIPWSSVASGAALEFRYD